MTSTSVKDVSTVMKAFTPNVVSGKNTNSSVSFQDVWSSQTNQNTASDASAKETRKDTGSVEKAQRGESLKRKDIKKADQKENTPAESLNVEEKDLEKAMEVLGTAATELMQEIADTFGMSMEELEQLMADMNMEAVDVLDPGKLSALLLAAGGAQDTLALLTDEELCNNFQMLMNRQKELLTEVSAELQVTPEQLTQLVEEMNVEEVPLVEAADTQEEPRITVEIDDSQTANVSETESTSTLTENAVAEPEKKQDNSQEQHADTAKDQRGNLLLQNLKADNLNPEAQQVAEAAKTSVWDENTQDIMKQIMDYMKVQVKSDTSSLEMQLHPASLGTLQVNVASKGGVLTASFVTQNETVKAVLESQMAQLKENFAEQGVKVEAIEVTVQTHQFERNLEQGRGRQQGETAKKDRPRRINLNASLGMDDVEEMTEEEQLAAEIMTANGSTVDYTA